MIYLVGCFHGLNYSFQKRVQKMKKINNKKLNHKQIKKKNKHWNTDKILNYKKS